MAHGYLFAQFFSPRTNRRTDAYAAPLAFATEVLAALRGRWAPTSPSACASPRTSGSRRAWTRRRAPTWPGTSAPRGSSTSHRSRSGTRRRTSARTGSCRPRPEPRTRSARRSDLSRRGRRARHRDHAGRRPRRRGGARHGGRRGRRGHDAGADRRSRPRRQGRARRAVIACIGCNQACIGHYHAGVPIGCVVNPRTGRERTLRPATPDGHPARVLSSAGARPGCRLRSRPPRTATTSCCSSGTEALGGQFALAGRAPAHREAWQRWRAWTRRALRAPRWRCGCGRRRPQRTRASTTSSSSRPAHGRSRPTRRRRRRVGRPIGRGHRDRRRVDRDRRRPSPGRCSSPTGAAGGTGLDVAEVLAEPGST